MSISLARDILCNHTNACMSRSTISKFQFRSKFQRISKYTYFEIFDIRIKVRMKIEDKKKIVINYDGNCNKKFMSIGR